MAAVKRKNCHLRKIILRLKYRLSILVLFRLSALLHKVSGALHGSFQTSSYITEEQDGLAEYHQDELLH